MVFPYRNIAAFAQYRRNFLLYRPLQQDRAQDSGDTVHGKPRSCLFPQYQQQPGKPPLIRRNTLLDNELRRLGRSFCLCLPQMAQALRP